MGTHSNCHRNSFKRNIMRLLNLHCKNNSTCLQDKIRIILRKKRILYLKNRFGQRYYKIILLFYYLTMKLYKGIFHLSKINFLKLSKLKIKILKTNLIKYFRNIKIFRMFFRDCWIDKKLRKIKFYFSQGI